MNSKMGQYILVNGTMGYDTARELKFGKTDLITRGSFINLKILEK